MKIFDNAKSEIKFASKTFGVSQIFHTRKRISSQSDFTRREANSTEKRPSQLTWSFSGGDGGDRTHDLLNAIQALSQLSYAPVCEHYDIT